MSAFVSERGQHHGEPGADAAIVELMTPTVTIDGRELTAAARRSLGTVRIRQEVSAPAVCELELDLPADLRPAHGMAVEVRMGVSDAAFSGEIVAVSHHLGPDGIHRLRLRCFDASHRLRQTGRVVAHTDVTTAELAETLATPHGLVVEADEPGPRWPRVIQQGESDCELLSRLAALAGLWWQVENGRLRLRTWRRGADHQVTWGLDLLEAVVASDLTSAAGSVRTFGWDPVERAVWDVSADTSGAGGPGASGDEAIMLAGRVCASSDHAEALAQSELDYRAGAASTVRAVVRGAAHWRPGVGLTITGQPEATAGPFLVTAVEHVVDAFTGYVCIVSSQPPPPPVRTSAATTAFAIAVVTEVDDPGRAGRVRVRFPAFDDVESEWLPVLALGAGEDKGLLCQPDAGDTVLVLHAAEDAGRGVVLGGIFADHLPGDAAGVSDGGVRRFGWNTSDGQRLVLNRDGDSVVVSNAAGSRIEITKDAVLLHAEADLTIEAPGRRLVLRADTVDFERG